MTLPALSAASLSAGLQVNCSPATPGDYFIATFLICILLAQIKVSSKYNATMELFFDQQRGQ